MGNIEKTSPRSKFNELVLRIKTKCASLIEPFVTPLPVIHFSFVDGNNSLDVMLYAPKNVDKDIWAKLIVHHIGIEPQTPSAIRNMHLSLMLWHSDLSEQEDDNDTILKTMFSQDKPKEFTYTSNSLNIESIDNLTPQTSRKITP